MTFRITKAKLNEFIACENGATMIEYAVIVSLLSIIMINTWTNIGAKLDGTFDTVDKAVSN